MRKEEEAFIRENQMIDKGDRVIAAVSGGADSVCMLHLLVALKKYWNLIFSRSMSTTD